MIKNLFIIAIVLGLCCGASRQDNTVYAPSTRYIGRIQGTWDEAFVITVEGKKFLLIDKSGSAPAVCLIPD